MTNTHKIEQLTDLYNAIYNCSLCHDCPKCNVKKDVEKVKRKLFNHIIESKIFIVAQSLAENQVRLSGIPYHDINGKLSSGGTFIEKYFNKINYTLKPVGNNYKLVYTTDVIQCFPGKKLKGSGDNTPTTNEILNCKKWFSQELELLKPKIILLFGSPATKTFYEYYLNEKTVNLSDCYLKPKKFNNVEVYSLPHPTSMVIGKSDIYEITFKNLKLIL